MDTTDDEITGNAAFPGYTESNSSIESAGNDTDMQKIGAEQGHILTSRSKGVASDVKFIQSTYLMLEECSRENPHIISWTKEGNAIEVKDKDALETTILRKYYNSSKYETFARQLNKYGFKRLKPEAVRSTRAPDGSVRDIFQHAFFQQGQRELLTKIQKKRSKGGASKEFDCKEEVISLQVKLSSLEEGHFEILRSMRKIQETLDEKLHKRRLTSQNEDTLERMDKRLRYVEDCVATLMNQRHERQHSWPSSTVQQPADDSFAPLRHHHSMPSTATMPGTFADANPYAESNAYNPESVSQSTNSGLRREETDDSAVNWIKGIYYMKED